MSTHSVTSVSRRYYLCKQYVIINTRISAAKGYGELGFYVQNGFMTAVCEEVVCALISIPCCQYSNEGRNVAMHIYVHAYGFHVAAVNTDAGRG